MAVNDVSLTHEEIWDDSALVESWNEALDEYKKYHSIHAKGGSLSELEALVAKESQKHTKNVLDKSKIDNAGSKMETTTENAPESGSIPEGKAPSIALPPQALLSSMRDDNLKKLLMSWYYAGYYTGLYEGQQQAQQAAEQ